MSTLLLNLIVIASITLMGAVIIIYIYPELRRNITSAMEPSGELIRQCVRDSWKLQVKIHECRYQSDLEQWYWEIEQYEQYYAPIVPSQLLREQMVRLQNSITLRRDKLTLKVS